MTYSVFGGTLNHAVSICMCVCSLRKKTVSPLLALVIGIFIFFKKISRAWNVYILLFVSLCFSVP